MRSLCTRGAVALIAGVLLLITGCTAEPLFAEDDPLMIAGGGTSGVYYAYGEALAEELSDELSAPITVVHTDGSIDNLRRIARGEALLGFSQSDAAVDAVRGEGAFTEALPIRAVARLYDEFVHVVVRADSPVTELAALEGRAVSLGAAGSGVHVVATRVLTAAGIRVDDHGLDLAESLRALEQHEIEGFFWVGAAPTPAVAQLSEDLALRLLSIPTDVVEALDAQHPGVYRFADLPARAYPWADPVSTLAVPNYLVVATDTRPALVERALARLFDARGRITSRVSAAALLDRRSAIFTGSLELHPGAEAYYRAARG